LVVLASSVLFFWFAMTFTSSLLLGVVMWEIFHDIQYNALIWHTQTQRVQSQAKAPWLDRFMFGPGSWRWIIYLLLIGGYGYIGIASSYLDIHFPEKVIDGEKSSRWMLQLIAVSALLHFYFDGFIWRIRNQSIRKELGIKETQPTTATKSNTVQSVTHALKWGLFFIPVGMLAYAQQHGMKSDSVAMVHNLAQTIPNSWTAHFMSATFHKIEGDYDQAAVEFQKTVQHNPKFDIAHMLLADVMFHKDSINQAIEHYRIATELEPKNIEAQANLAYLYLLTGQAEQAINHYWKAVDAEPKNEDFRLGLSTALLKVGRVADSEKQLREVLSKNPHQTQALNDMGMIRHAQGRLNEAIEYYQTALDLDSTLVETRKHLDEVSALTAPPL
jgi:tetratricopeptide (TPR) repeat protein